MRIFRNAKKSVPKILIIISKISFLYISKSENFEKKNNILTF